MSRSIEMEIAKKIQEAAVRAAREGFNEASMSGLCSEGAIEAAVGAIQLLDLEELISESQSLNTSPK